LDEPSTINPDENRDRAAINRVEHNGGRDFCPSPEIQNANHPLCILLEKSQLVQKMFRGFHSRKHKHNFYLRKHYLEQVAAKGEEIRVKVERHYQESKAVEEHMTAVQRMESFEKVKTVPYRPRGKKTKPPASPPFGDQPPNKPCCFDEYGEGWEEDVLLTRPDVRCSSLAFAGCW
jgi:hypothetical protein